MERIIEFNQVSFAYADHSGERIQALDRIDLGVKRGDFIAVIGPNGSGKSSLAKHINALLYPNSGTVRVDGKETSRGEYTWEIRRLAGMIFQNPDNQLVAATVEEDIAFGLENLGIAPEEMEQRINRVLQQLDMEHLRHKKPHELSGGQKQRAAIAGVLAMEPEVLILDEATSMLDPQARTDFLRIIQELNRAQQMTVILITHDLAEVLEASRVIVMDRGKIVKIGSPPDVFADFGTRAETGMKLPFTLELKKELMRRKFPIASSSVTSNDLVNDLCRYILTG